MNIFQLSEEFMFLMQDIEELEGEITPEIEERLKINKEDFQDKMDAYANIKTMKEGEIKTIDDEIARLIAIKKSKERVVENIKKYALIALELWGTVGKTGNKKFETATHKFWNVYHKPLVIDNEEEVPNNFINCNLKGKYNIDTAIAIVDICAAEGLDIELSESEIDRVAIKEALKNGESFNFAHLDEKASYVVIK